MREILLENIVRGRRRREGWNLEENENWVETHHIEEGRGEE